MYLYIIHLISYLLIYVVIYLFIQFLFLAVFVLHSYRAGDSQSKTQQITDVAQKTTNLPSNIYFYKCV